MVGVERNGMDIMALHHVVLFALLAFWDHGWASGRTGWASGLMDVGMIEGPMVARRSCAYTGVMNLAEGRASIHTC